MPSTTASKSRRGRRKWAWPCRQIKLFTMSNCITIASPQNVSSALRTETSCSMLQFFALIETHLMESLETPPAYDLESCTWAEFWENARKNWSTATLQAGLTSNYLRIPSNPAVFIPVNLDVTCLSFLPSHLFNAVPKLIDRQKAVTIGI